MLITYYVSENPLISSIEVQKIYNTHKHIIRIHTRVQLVTKPFSQNQQDDLIIIVFKTKTQISFGFFFYFYIYNVWTKHTAVCGIEILSPTTA